MVFASCMVGSKDRGGSTVLCKQHHMQEKAAGNFMASLHRRGQDWPTRTFLQFIHLSIYVNRYQYNVSVKK